jgi:hypothetical protein
VFGLSVRRMAVVRPAQLNSVAGNRLISGPRDLSKGFGAVQRLFVDGRRLGAGAANGQPIDTQGRLTYTDRHALSFLAAGADAVIELEIVYRSC